MESGSQWQLAGGQRHILPLSTVSALREEALTSHRAPAGGGPPPTPDLLTKHFVLSPALRPGPLCPDLPPPRSPLYQGLELRGRGDRSSESLAARVCNLTGEAVPRRTGKPGQNPPHKGPGTGSESKGTALARSPLLCRGPRAGVTGVECQAMSSASRARVCWTVSRTVSLEKISSPLWATARPKFSQ